VGDTRSPVIVSAIDLGAFVALALALRGPWGHVGVSVAVTGASAVQLVLLWWLVRRHLPHRGLREIVPSLLRTGVASGVGLAAARLVALALEPWLTGDGLARLAPGLVAAGAFGPVFLVTARLLRCPELSSLTEPLHRRLRRRR